MGLNVRTSRMIKSITRRLLKEIYTAVYWRIKSDVLNKQTKKTVSINVFLSWLGKLSNGRDLQQFTNIYNNDIQNWQLMK